MRMQEESPQRNGTATCRSQVPSKAVTSGATILLKKHEPSRVIHEGSRVKKGEIGSADSHSYNYKYARSGFVRGLGAFSANKCRFFLLGRFVTQAIV